MKTNKTKEPTREPSPGAKENPWVIRGLPLGYPWVIPVRKGTHKMRGYHVIILEQTREMHGSRIKSGG